MPLRLHSYQYLCASQAIAKAITQKNTPTHKYTNPNIAPINNPNAVVTIAAKRFLFPRQYTNNPKATLKKTANPYHMVAIGIS